MKIQELRKIIKEEIYRGKLTPQQKSEIDKALIGLKKKAGPEYKKAARTIVDIAQEVTGDESINSPLKALRALDYIEPKLP